MIRDEIDDGPDRSIEPRLDPATRSRSSATRAARRRPSCKVRFLVRADLICEPVNVPVEFVADVELDSGKIAINRL